MPKGEFRGYQTQKKVERNFLTCSLGSLDTHAFRSTDEPKKLRTSNPSCPAGALKSIVCVEGGGLQPRAGAAVRWEELQKEPLKP